MTDPLVFKLALSFVPWLTAEMLENFFDAGGQAADFFTFPIEKVAAMIGLNKPEALRQMQREEALTKGEREYQFVTSHSIHALFIADDDYPAGVRELHDAPLILYCLGDLKALLCRQPLSIVGTRRLTPYGAAFCRDTVAEMALAVDELCIVSGLAYGVDAQAHRASLMAEAKTIAVVAHGLDMIYPSQHRDLAREIVRSGSLILSEYPHGVKPWRGNFLARNRIIAALGEGTLVVESDVKGGAMSTANSAFELSREVMALPGRADDPMSAGCNALIRRGKASLITSASEIMATLGWQVNKKKVDAVQKTLFTPANDPDQQLIITTLKAHNGPMAFDALLSATGLSAPCLLSMLSDMECDDLVLRLPGNRFKAK